MVKEAAVIVLGDIGRSPRMCNHALSLVNQANMNVNIIGYQESQPLLDIINNNNITIQNIKAFPSILPRKFLLFYAPFKLLYQIFQLLWTLLFIIPSPDIILVQNPPSIPILFVLFLFRILQIISFRKHPSIIIDWHNFGYTILQLSFSKHNPIIYIAKLYERIFGRIAHANLCVTEAMSEFLYNEWNIKASVLYDKPPDYFKKLTLQEKHLLMKEIQDSYELDFFNTYNKPDNIPNNLILEEYTLLTIKCKDDNNNIYYFERENKPVLFVSSTSWTPDEDFSILLEAVIKYEKILLSNNNNDFPQILLFITGKGPLKEYYEGLIKEKHFLKTKIVTVWLSAENYPKLLGICDMGICLHTSSSGLDLPMKVVDMFGCKLPVCAINFLCLHELVHHEENGLVFNSSNELAEQIIDLLKDYPECKKLIKMGNSIKEESWNESWKRNALPVIQSVL